MTIAAHPRAVADAADGTVISIITEDNGVRNIFRGKDGFLSGDVRGKLFIEMSTLQPMTGARACAGGRGRRRPADRVAGARHHPARCATASCSPWSAARPEDLERARPVLEKLTRKIVHMGPNGAGYAMKLAVNLGLAAFIQATAESLALGTREGLSTAADARRAGRSADRQRLVRRARRACSPGEPADVTLDLKTLRKDIMSAVATGALSGTGMPLSSGVLTSLSAAVAQGWGDKDIGELARFFREHMGQKFELGTSTTNADRRSPAHAADCASAAERQLRHLFARQRGVAHRHVDGADRDRLADLAIDRVGFLARRRGVRRLLPGDPDRADRRRRRRPLGPAAASSRSASSSCWCRRPCCSRRPPAATSTSG